MSLVLPKSDPAARVVNETAQTSADTNATTTTTATTTPTTTNSTCITTTAAAARDDKTAAAIATNKGQQRASVNMKGPSRLRHMQSQPNMRYATPQLTPTHAVMQSPLHPQQHQTSQPPVMSRTQHKLMLQRQSFLADDKDYLEHPNNMRRLTKELDRVNREYRFVRHFEDPLAESFRRVVSSSPPPNLYMNNNSYNTSSAEHPAYYRTSPSPPPRLNRRSSAQECLLAVKDQPEEHPKGFLSRLFNNNASSSTSTSSSSSSTASTHSCGYTNYPTGASSINCHPLAAPLQPPPPPFSNALATTSTTNPRRVT